MTSGQELTGWGCWRCGKSPIFPYSTWISMFYFLGCLALHFRTPLGLMPTMTLLCPSFSSSQFIMPYKYTRWVLSTNFVCKKKHHQDITIIDFEFGIFLQRLKRLGPYTCISILGFDFRMELLYWNRVTFNIVITYQVPHKRLLLWTKSTKLLRF